MNRESYLRALAEGLEPLFQAQGAAYPERIRYTCGWPSRGAGARRKALGQCFDPAASKDDHHEIIIGMSLDDPVEVAHTLAHELCHAIVGTKHGHRAPFRKLALAVGLVGKMTSTTAGEAFTRHVQPILDGLGPYPHAELDYSTVKKQTTRMIKAMCDECGYTVRLTRKWLDAAGPPICPTHETTMTDNESDGAPYSVVADGSDQPGAFATVDEAAAAARVHFEAFAIYDRRGIGVKQTNEARP